mgnify:CR=1 FL=1
MLLSLATWLQALSPDFGFFRVFQYLTFRAVMAAMTALVIGIFAGPWVIRKLTELKIGQAVRVDGPQTHLIKSGTPTMGGALILISVFLATILWADLGNRFVWIVLVVTMGFGAVGWVDDYRKVVHRNPKGMSAKEKYLWQSLIGLGAAVDYLQALGMANIEAREGELLAHATEELQKIEGLRIVGNSASKAAVSTLMVVCPNNNSAEPAPQSAALTTKR